MKPLGRLAARFSFVLAALGAACGGGPSHVAPDAPQPAGIAKAPDTTTKVKHVVIMIQENRSFDNLFATFPNADGALQGKVHGGARVRLLKRNLLLKTDMFHGYS